MKLLNRFQKGLASTRAFQSFRRPTRKVIEIDATEAGTDEDSSVETESVLLTETAPCSTSRPLTVTAPVQPQQQQPEPEKKAPVVKRVRFSDKKNGREKRSIRRITKFTNPDLWYQLEETCEIQERCIDLVEENRQGPNCMDGPTVRFIERGWKDSAKRSHEILSKMKEVPEVRGLERHIVQKYDDLMNEHIRNVLEIQRTTESEYLLRLASRQSSQAWEELARIRAQYDEAAVSRRKSKQVAAL